MRVGYRNVAPAFAFLWSDASQPAARWHGEGEGPAHYFADTPDGAWAEFLRHEEIDDESDLVGVSRSLWAVEIPDVDVDTATEVDLPEDTGLAGYLACQHLAREVRATGSTAVRTSSAALTAGGATGRRCELGALLPGSARDGQVWVLFGERPDLSGWVCVERGAPGAALLDRVLSLGGG